MEVFCLFNNNEVTPVTVTSQLALKFDPSVVVAVMVVVPYCFV